MLPKNAYYHAFNLLPGCGPATVKSILAKSGLELDQAWRSFPGLGIRTDLITHWRHVDPEKEWEKLMALQIQVVSLEQKEYPSLLRQTSTAPLLLYYLGKLNLPIPSLTVVGTRSMTWYGQKAVQHLIGPLAEQKIGVVSGLAMGIDTEAHETALKHGAYTMAVLGSGLNVISPPSNLKLAQRIVSAGGCILSQFPPDTHGSRGTFPQRNCTMAGLTSVTVVIEAAQKSGALITADRAMDFNREVGMVPGSIFSPTSFGCLERIKKGAAIIRNVGDILALLDSPLSFYPLHQPQPELIGDEAIVYKQLEDTARSFDDLGSATPLATQSLITTLSILEMKGLITRLPGRGYVRLA